MRALAPGARLVHPSTTGSHAGRYRPAAPGERDALRAELGWDARPRVVFVGRMVAKKGVEHRDRGRGGGRRRVGAGDRRAGAAACEPSRARCACWGRWRPTASAAVDPGRRRVPAPVARRGVPGDRAGGDGERAPRDPRRRARLRAVRGRCGYRCAPRSGHRRGAGRGRGVGARRPRRGRARRRARAPGLLVGARGGRARGPLGRPASAGSPPGRPR